MHKTEMYIREDQIDALQSLAFFLTKKEKKRVGVAELVREAIDSWLKQHKPAEMDLILSSPALLGDIATARKELHEGKLLSRKEALGK